MGNRFFASFVVVLVGSVCVVCGLPAQTTPGAGDPTPATPIEQAEIEQAELPATGRQATTFRVPTFGRWSVALASERGVALQLVDRVSGPGEMMGEAGQQDGRLDLFLDRGEYKVFSLGPEPSGGSDLGLAKLRVEPFREIEERAVTLPDLARVSTRLGDLEQVSWWLEIDTTQRVAFEAAGRHLADLRLWREGTWMVGAAPEFEQVEPVVGRPLAVCRLATELPPGLYRLTAYGGAGLPWADDDGTRPLYLRSGLDRRGEAGRSLLAVSEFGVDRFVVPASASYVRLEVPGGDLRDLPLTLEVGDWREEAPYRAEYAETSTVHKELRVMAVEQYPGTDEGGQRLITVRGAAGQPYVLQHFRSEETYYFSQDGEYWIDTVHSGHPADAVEATGLLLDLTNWDRHQTPVRADTLQLRTGEVLERRFNLLETATLFLEVVQNGRYEISTSGVDASFRLEPYWRPDRARDEERPPPRSDGGVWDLDRGYYVLSLEPRSQGIADLTLRSVDRTADGGADAAAGVSGPSPTARLGRVFLEKNYSYLFHLNHQPGVQSGVVLRPLPLDLSQPLPFVVGGGERTLTVPFRVPGAGVLRAVTEDDAELRLSETASAAEAADAEVGWTTLPVSGSGTVTVTPPDDLELPVAASLFWEPKHRREPLPDLPEGSLEALPELPTLTARKEEFLRLDRGRSGSYLVRADEAALYRLESTGLLDTAGVLRTRVVPEVERVDGEGTGRNFLIQRYLGAGEYQLTVEAKGRSAGHLGLRLGAAPVRPAGRLLPNVPARGWIDPGESLEYRFDVPEPGAWRVRVLGLGDAFPVRIEDADGWPIVRPGLSGDRTVWLDAGEHRLVVLPRAVRSRHVALVSPVPEPPERSGHGPFELALEERAEHVWSEETAAFRALPEDASLPPDRWRFRLSAEVGLDVELSRDVVAELVRSPGSTDEEIVGEVTALRGLEGDVPAGDYELRVRPARRNNRVEYQLRVEPRQLLPGRTTEVSVPGSFELRVGEGREEGSLVEIASLGAVDVRARLLDDDGRELAQSDDRPGDWNLRLVRRLDAGAYRVNVATTGEGGRVVLAVSTLEELDQGALPLGSDGLLSASLVPGRSVHLWSLDSYFTDSAWPGSVLMARAESAEGLRLTVEALPLDAQDGGRWRPVASGEGPAAWLAYALTPGERLRLRLEALGRGSSDVTVRAAWTGDDMVDEARLARGVRVPDVLGGRGLVAVRTDGPGCFDLSTAGDDVLAAGFAGTALRPAPDLAAADSRLLVEAPSGTTVRAERWRWSAEARPRRLRLAAEERARCDLRASDEALLLSARGLGGLAGLAVGDGGAQALTGDETLALALPRSGQATIRWFREGEDGGAGMATQEGSVGEVELTAEAFAVGAPESATARPEGGLDAGAARIFALPAGSLRLRLALQAGVAASVTSGRQVELLHRAGPGGVELVRDLEVAAEGEAYLRILGPARGSGRFDVSVLPRGHDASALAMGRPFERRVTRVGVVDLPLAALDSEQPLRVHGAERVTVLGADGSVRRSTEPNAAVLAPTGGGRLAIEHAPGVVVAWIGDSVDELAGSSALAPAQPLALPSVRGLEEVGDGLGVHVDLPAPRVLHLRSPTAALSIVGDDVTLHPESLSLDTWLPAGRTDVRLRPLAGESLGGEMEATASEVVEIGEGLGPEILLAPGGERWVSFEVDRAGEVGVAVRADSEVVSLRWLDARGRALDGTTRGMLQMAELPPGRYLLALSLGAEHAPVRVRPVVVGLEPPSGPPEDVVRHYLEMASISGTNGAGTEEAP